MSLTEVHIFYKCENISYRSWAKPKTNIHFREAFVISPLPPRSSSWQGDSPSMARESALADQVMPRAPALSCVQLPRARRGGHTCVGSPSVFPLASHSERAQFDRTSRKCILPAQDLIGAIAIPDFIVGRRAIEIEREREESEFYCRVE